MEHDRLISRESSPVCDAEREQEQLHPVSPIEDRASALPNEQHQRQTQQGHADPPENGTSALLGEDEHLTPDVQKDTAGSTKQTGMQAMVTQEKKKSDIPTAKLRRSGYVTLLVILYSTLAVFAWTVLCILTKRPIVATLHYGTDFDTRTAYGNTGASVIHSFYTQNENWRLAAEVIQAIVAVLTIPLTSAVCSQAAVAFVQRRSHGRLSLRQTMVLADRGWTDPIMYLKMLAGGFKRYGTVFLLGATLLNILGGVISPLYAYFVTTETIKTPTFPDILTPVTDIVDQFDPGLRDNNLVTVMARSAMTSTNVFSPQGRLWTGASINCTEALNRADAAPLPMSCVYGVGNTLDNLTQLPDPFLAQLQSGYSTGVIRQYLLRVNSTAHREIVAEADFPADCGTLPGAFYARYGSTNPNILDMTGWGNWSFEACMPANVSDSPWKATRNRQDFTEELYLNISLDAISPTYYFTTPQEKGGLFKITLDTTAGFFELPNYMNGQRPGELLEESPVTLCGGDCAWQAGTDLDNSDDVEVDSNRLRRDNEDFNMTSNSSLALEMLSNRGPLSTIALALFGSSSFIAERIANPDGFVYPNMTWEEYQATPNAGACVAQAPFMGLLGFVTDTGDQIGNPLSPCLTNDVHDHDDVQNQLVNFIHTLYYNTWDGYEINDGSRITNAFTAAAFLTNEAWLLSTSSMPTWSIYYDMGADTMIPVISTAGIVIVSSLLGLFLTALLTLAAYSAWVPRWTDQLNAFALLRLGASLANDIPLKIAHNVGDIAALDKLPGWIGDATEGEGAIGELAVGGKGSLTARREYAAYSLDKKGEE